jgi:hypothetical protein
MHYRRAAGGAWIAALRCRAENRFVPSYTADDADAALLKKFDNAMALHPGEDTRSQLNYTLGGPSDAGLNWRPSVTSQAPVRQDPPVVAAHTPRPARNTVSQIGCAGTRGGMP